MMSPTNTDLDNTTHNPAVSNSEMPTITTKHVLTKIVKTPHIAIIGAGISGLRAADVLLRAGFRVTCFEARDYIGGRCHQIRTSPSSTSNSNGGGGYQVDTGSNWIHGTKNNPIMKLARRTNTAVMEPDERNISVDRYGHMLSEEASGELSAEFWAGVQEAFKFSDKNWRDIDPDVSLLDYLTERWEGGHKDKSTAERDDSPRNDAARDSIVGSASNGKGRKIEKLIDESRMWGQFVASPISTQSLRFLWLEEVLEGATVFVASTYASILQEIARPVLGHQNFESYLDTEVQEIFWRGGADGDGQSEGPLPDSISGGRDQVSLVTDKGELRSFDEIVVTCPLGWLKSNHRQVFSPPLPGRVKTAIENIGYGVLEKLYVTFERAWWMDDKHTTQGDRERQTGSASDSGSTEDTKPNTYPCFTHFHPPTYHPLLQNQHKAQMHSQSDSSPPQPQKPHSPTSPPPLTSPNSKTQLDFNTWNQSVVSLSHLPTSTAQPTLLFYLHGSAASFLTSSLSPHSPLSEAYTRICASFAQPFYSRLPNFSPTDPICTPRSYTATSWSTDPLSGHGSYTTHRTGTVAADEDLAVLREGRGMDGGGIWWAGEHTAPDVALGTTTGAWWSGERVGKGIAELYGLEVDWTGDVSLDPDPDPEPEEGDGDGDGEGEESEDGWIKVDRDSVRRESGVEEEGKGVVSKCGV